MSRRSNLLIALSLAFVGCSKPAADKALIYGSSKDIETFFRDARVKAKMADCENIRVKAEVTRGLSCTTKMDAESLRLLISRVAIAKDQPDRGDGKEGRCEFRPGFGSEREGIEIWRANWTCADKGRPFTYLEVRVAPATDEACVEVFPLACD